MKTHPLSRRSKTSERGQSLTELALLLPLLLLMLVGVLDVSRAYNAFLSITNASREGARYGVNKPGDASGITARVNNELNGTGITGVSVSSACYDYTSQTLSKNCNPQDNSNPVVSGDRIAVTVTAPFTLISTQVLGLTSLTLRNTATMAIILP